MTLRVSLTLSLVQIALLNGRCRTQAEDVPGNGDVGGTTGSRGNGAVAVAYSVRDGEEQGGRASQPALPADSAHRTCLGGRRQDGIPTAAQRSHPSSRRLSSISEHKTGSPANALTWR